VPNADRTQVAWLTLGCPESGLVAPTVLHVDARDGSRGWTRELDRHSLLFVTGFVGDAVVVSGWLDPPRIVRETGPIAVIAQLRHAVDTHGTLVAGRDTVVDTATGALLWRRPGTSLTAFSPDGRWLVGGRGGATVLLDARTGALRATLPGRLSSLAWEDDRHLLAVSYRGGHEALVRIGLDGRAELLAEPRPSTSQTWVFESQP
jgi:hypothetical protein